MKNKKTLFLIVLLFVLLMGGAAVLYRQLGQNIAPNQLAAQQTQPAESSAEEHAENPKAPDFVVYDAEGREVRLSDYIGKPIVLNFWASWCGPCQGEMPDFQQKYEELGEEIQFLMVNMTDGSRETLETAQTFVKEHAYTFPVFYDTDTHAAAVYGVYSLPTTYFIDADGYAVAQASGAIDAELLQKGIDMIR